MVNDWNKLQLAAVRHTITSPVTRGILGLTFSVPGMQWVLADIKSLGSVLLPRLCYLWTNPS